jgi:hypothetical protein
MVIVSKCRTHSVSPAHHSFSHHDVLLVREIHGQ